MKDQQESGIDSWRYLVRANPGRTGVETYLPLILSVAAALGVAPFAVIRYLNGDLPIAILDTLIVAGFVTMGTFVYRTGRIRLASVAISLLCIGGVVLSVYATGTRQVLWAYPALIAAYYLTKPREALLLTLVLLIALLPKLLPETDTFRTATILITITVMSLFAYAFSVITNRQRQMLVQLATRDPLTGAGNRRALDEKLDAAVAMFNRNATPSALILLDLDDFKAVNDRHGHATGDQILNRVTEIVNLRIRVTDSLYRIGGEEFVVVLEGQSIARAQLLAEQLRTLVEVNELVPDHLVTISLGVAEIRRGDSAADWLARADDALYRAKRAGRNQTRLAV